MFLGMDKGIKLDKATEKIVLDEMSQYQLVRTRIITWERLDEDREGETIYKDFYPLGTDECPLDHYVVLEDNQFAGIGIFYTETASWNAGLNKTKSRGACTLYKDGRVVGSPFSHSTYDSPNNFDDVTITYSLRKKQ